MCGIIGVTGGREVTPLLLEGLKRLKYRGYDSAGIATLSGGALRRCRAEGRLIHLEAALQAQPLTGTTGIGHTRWATHGAPSVVNAHPHATDFVAIVHNGIIENFQDLRDDLCSRGRSFVSGTDTEAVAHLVDEALMAGATPQEAVAQVLPRLEGAFAFVMIFRGHEGLMIGARRGSPLVIGYGDGEMYFGSDAFALAPLTDRLCYLEEGDWAVVTPRGATLFDAAGAPATRAIVRSVVSGALAGKGNHRHFMEKEIHEQPTVVGDTLLAFLDPLHRAVTLPALPLDLARVSSIAISACGTAYYAGLVARGWIEALARIPVTVEVASEFRYRDAPVRDDALALFISQSGETMDTLEALRLCRRRNQTVVSVVNVPESTIDRESHGVLRTHAGPEIGVASTKAFTTQLAALACFAIALGRARGTVSALEETRLVTALAEAPGRMAELLHRETQHGQIAAVAEILAEARDVLYLGRGAAWPIAMEGALKLKEVSYIHAEGYPAGEMKHGPIALIDDQTPVVVMAPSSILFEKIAANIQEVIARRGKVIVLSDQRGIDRLRRQMMPAAFIALPEVDAFIVPLLYAVPAQLLAYHTAVLKGTDVDQPRNLAKSVTVE